MGSPNQAPAEPGVRRKPIGRAPAHGGRPPISLRDSVAVEQFSQAVVVARQERLILTRAGSVSTHSMQNQSICPPRRSLSSSAISVTIDRSGGSSYRNGHRRPEVGAPHGAGENSAMPRGCADHRFPSAGIPMQRIAAVSRRLSAISANRSRHMPRKRLIQKVEPEVVRRWWPSLRLSSSWAGWRGRPVVGLATETPQARLPPSACCCSAASTCRARQRVT